MVNAFTENTFSTTYKDDWRDSDHYHRILFNSGRALQARELTQMQTIIQEEISKFGRNVFRDGASVNPGGATIRNNVEYVKLDTTLGETPTSAIVGTVFTATGGSEIKARVIRVVDAEGSDPATLYVQYTDTSAGTAGTEPVRFLAGEAIDNGSVNLRVQTTAPHVGQGTEISNAGGDFFARGHFVFAEPQTIILDKYGTTPTKEVGFRITEDIVTASDNAALFDNQGATPNRASPGADRYRIRLTLINKADLAADENFVYFCNVINGEIVETVTSTSEYNAPAQLVAESLSDTNGNFIAKEFRLDFVTDSSVDANIIARVPPGGVAFVNGYRAAAEQGANITISKPRTTVTQQNDIVGISYGNYIKVDTLEGNLGNATFAQQNLSTSATDPSGSVIGTARVRYVEEDGANYKVYLFDIEMTSGQSFRDVRSIGTDDDNFAAIITEGGVAVLNEPTNRTLLFPLTNIRPSDISDVDFEVQQLLTGTATGTTLTLSTTGSEYFSNTSQWIVTAADSGGVIDGFGTTLTGSPIGSGVNITGLPSGASVNVYAKVNKTNAQSRQKTLTERAFSTHVESDGNGVAFVDLHRSDLFEVISIKETDSDGRDLSSNFTIDDGQRPGFYDNARYILSTGVTPPASVFTRFKHFTHGVGDFFDMTSYNGQIAYNQIPDYINAAGQKVSLRNVIDFRSSVDSAGEFTGSRAVINELPTTGDVFQADVDYYLGRSDRVVVNTDGTIKTVQGQPGFNRQLPAVPAGTLPLFNIDFPPYVLNDSDLSAKPLKHKRFQMKDIARLEERIDAIQEDLSLTYLELDTSTLLVQDSSGNIRTKSGFFADNFQDRTFSDTRAGDYRAAIDPSRQILSTNTINHSIDMVYDSDVLGNTILKGDNVYLKYSEIVAIKQDLVSGTENVNPFAVIIGEGNLTLSPASDTWIETTYIPEKVIDNGTEEIEAGSINEGILARGTANRRASTRLDWVNPTVNIPLLGFSGGVFNFNIGWLGLGTWRSAQSWNWNGTNNTGRVVVEGTRRRGRRRTDNTFSQRIITSEWTKREEIGDRTVSLTFLPWMRSRKIAFRAEGLRPNTQYFPFFDGQAVSSFCKTETTFDRHAAIGTDAVSYGDQYRLSASHPEGSENLVSDADGEIIGSFFLPSNPTTKFKAGTREFKLLDISVNQNDAATSRASTNYHSLGELDTRQKTIESTRIVELRTRRWTEVTWHDPLAQSFRTPEGNGIFVTKIDTFLNSNGETIVPIQMQIRPMVNGSPSASEIVPGAVVFVSASDVNDNTGATTQASVIANPTQFEFDEPIYLNPDEEYAIVLLADTTNYEAYVSETYAFELGSTERRINRQPSMGSLFKSQNGTTWTPDQTKDMTFRLYKAQFDTAGGYAVFQNRPVQNTLLNADSFFADSGDATVTMLLPGHGFEVDDKVTIAGLDSATTYNGILGSSIMGTKNVDAVDGFGIQFEADSATTSAGRFGGTTATSSRQFNYDILYPMFDALQPEDTTVDYQARLMTGSSFAGTETRYQLVDYTNDIEIKEENTFDFPRIIATPAKEATAGKSALFKVNLNTIDPDVGPYIDGQRASLILEENRIDRQAVAAVVGQFNAPLSYVAETDARFGSAMSKHITSVQVVPGSAVGVKVILAALRPNAASITLYYRTATGEENILDKEWTSQATEVSVAPDEANFSEYNYLIGGTEGTLTPFTEYQLKLVFESTNSSKIPVIKDLRAIALAT
jgi:hypothetical protein